MLRRPYQLLFIVLFLALLACEDQGASSGMRCPPITAACCEGGITEPCKASGTCLLLDADGNPIESGHCAKKELCANITEEPWGPYRCIAPCSEEQILCAAICIDPKNSLEFCGASGDCKGTSAGEFCSDGKQCVEGVCERVCATNEIVCDDACVDPKTSSAHCGASDDCAGANAGHACGETQHCVAGRCQIICPNDQKPCGERCVDIANDRENCGGCVAEGTGEACGEGEFCVDGQCSDTCPAPRTACQISCSDGNCGNVCTDTSKDPQNCGGCGVYNMALHICPSNASCKNSVCVCPEGWSGPTCTEPVCERGCQDEGRCIAPNKCECASGWGGSDCRFKFNRVRIPKQGDSTSFIMGRNYKIDTWGSTMEEHPHQVTLSAYEIDPYEVTALAYKYCVEDGGCTVPGKPEHPDYPDLAKPCTYGVEGKENHPINCIDWEQAKAFCEWANARLPTEAEWERAAKGTVYRRFPWGADCPTDWATYCDGEKAWTKDTARANCKEESSHDGYEETAPVGSFPLGVTSEGLHDMGGNVWEWISDWIERGYSEDAVTNPTGPETGDWRALRGSSWNSYCSVARTTFRSYAEPTIISSDFGVRCAKTVANASSD